MLFSLFNYINAQKVEILHGMTKYFCKNQRKHSFILKKLTQSKTVMLLWRIDQRFITVAVILEGNGFAQG